MRSPRRLSRPTTSERRRSRSEPSERPVSFKGIWTRRPSARIATATWRRLRPWNRPKAGLQSMPGRASGSRSLRGVPCSRNHLGPMESRSSSSDLGPMASRSSASDLGGSAASSLSQIRLAAPIKRDRRSPDGLSAPRLSAIRCRLFNAPSAVPPRERWRSWRVRQGPERPGRPEPSACESCRSVPAQAGAESEGQ